MFEFKDNPFDMKFNNRGRLSPKERKRMEFCLQAYYSQMIGILEASNRTGIHTRTVSKYFKNWDDDLLKSDNNSFIETCKINKIKRINAIDADIVNLSESENEINAMIKLAMSQNNVKDYVSLHKSLDKIINSRQKLQDQKIDLINTVTFDIDIASEIKKFSKPATDSNFDVIPLDIIPKINETDNSSTNSNYIKSNNKNNTVKKISSNSSDDNSCNVADVHSNTFSDIENDVNNNSSNNDSQENLPGRKLVP